MKKHMELVYKENEVVSIKFLVNIPAGNVKAFFIPGPDMTTDAAEALKPMLYEVTIKGNADTEVKVIEIIADEVGNRAAKLLYDGCLSVMREIEEDGLNGIEIQLDPGAKEDWAKFFENMRKEMEKTPAKNIVSRKEWD